MAASGRSESSIPFPCDCSICLENLKRYIAQLPCFHAFCLERILRAARSRHSSIPCPLCRPPTPMRQMAVLLVHPSDPAEDTPTLFLYPLLLLSQVLPLYLPLHYQLRLLLPLLLLLWQLVPLEFLLLPRSMQRPSLEILWLLMLLGAGQLTVSDVCAVSATRISAGQEWIRSKASFLLWIFISWLQKRQ